MKRWITKGFVLFSACLIPVDSPAFAVAGKPELRDLRLERIKAFFRRQACPVERYAAEFLAAADKNHLDWRLLPSLALVESSGGKVFVNNNVFGWNSGKHKFPSIAAGIKEVARELAEHPYYRGKTVDEKIKMYNGLPHYRPTVRRVMAELAAEPI